MRCASTSHQTIGATNEDREQSQPRAFARTHHPTPAAGRCSSSLHDSADGDPLVLNKWFSIQATADYKAGGSSKSVVESIKHLMDTHPKFSLKNPNVVRALVGAFANSNIAHFHAEDGSGYELVGKAVRDLDKLNGLVAARLAGVFSSWRKMEQGRSILMKQELEKIIAMEGLSKDTYEIVSLSLYAK